MTGPLGMRGVKVVTVSMCAIIFTLLSENSGMALTLLAL